MAFRRKTVRRAPKKRTVRRARRTSRRSIRSGGKFNFRHKAVKPLATTYASTTETVELFDFTAAQNGQPFNCEFNITSFPRASAMRSHFRWYRCTHVEWVYQPANSAYPTLSSAQNAVPYLYISMDRNGQAPYTNSASFLDAGILPKMLNRKISVKYVPNLVESIASVSVTHTATPYTRQVKMKWISTYDSDETPSTIWYYGHQCMVLQQPPSSTTTTEVARGYVRARWEFKEPFLVEDLEERLDSKLRLPFKNDDLAILGQGPPRAATGSSERSERSEPAS